MGTDQSSRPAAVRQRALLEAEVRQLLRAISPFGVLRRDALARACHAHLWRRGRFDDAVRQAVSEGRLRSLGAGFYGRPTEPPRDGLRDRPDSQ